MGNSIGGKYFFVAESFLDFLFSFFVNFLSFFLDFLPAGLTGVVDPLKFNPNGLG